MANLLFPIAISAAIVIILLVVLLFLAFFLDFVKDSWKLPFAAVVDIIDFVAIFSPSAFGTGTLDVVAMVGSLLVFIVLARSILKYPFAAVAGAEGAINLGTPFIPVLAAQVAALLPINTVLMFIDAIID